MKKIYVILIIIVLFAAGIYAVFLKLSGKNDSQIKEKNNVETNVSADASANNPVIKNVSHIITIKTDIGEISFATYDADAPKTVNNFITLVQRGFYDGTIFHRVIDGFMIQGGD